MQTLIDPFELASGTLPIAPAVVAAMPPMRPVAMTLADLDVVVDEEPPARPSLADRCGRARCWSSED